MKLCSYCGLPKEKFHSKYYYMCEECGKLYKRFTDLRSRVKNGSIAEANRADKKLMDIVDIYKERAAQGLKVPASLCEYTGGFKPKKILDRCEWCGQINVLEHSGHVGMCVECGKMYNNFMNARSVINKAVDTYLQRKKLGYRVPIILDEYIK